MTTNPTEANGAPGLTSSTAEELKAIRDLLIAATRRIDAITAEKTLNRGEGA